jgi:hypothetical protein
VPGARLAVTVAVAVLASGCFDALGANQGPTLPQALLLPGASSVIVVEVDAVSDRAPRPEALELLRKTLEEVTGKPVALAGPTAIPSQGGRYRESDLVRIHRETAFFSADGYLQHGQAVLHVLYLDGQLRSDGDRHTLGRTILSEGLIVVFRDRYSQAYRLLNGTEWADAAGEMDRHVLLHEAGHALGLVGNGVPEVRDHSDPGSPGHSRYPESVMYGHPPMTPQQLVTGTVSTSFDVDDLADLAAFRASARPAAAPPDT